MRASCYTVSRLKVEALESNRQTGSPQPRLCQGIWLPAGYSVSSESEAWWILVVQRLTEEASLLALWYAYHVRSQHALC